tara:strand:- start:6341 stop:6808 length:468 start_codon:yes stop_codon:yes gene_type:complete
MKKTNTLPEELVSICDKASQVNSCTLYGIIHDTQNHTISVLVENKESNVTLNNCEKIIKHIQLTWPEKYQKLLQSNSLEVSTPGLDRPLLEYDHFTQQVGNTISCQIKNGDKHKKIKGLLQNVSNDIITILVTDEVTEIPFSEIISCHLNNEIKV